MIPLSGGRPIMRYAPEETYGRENYSITLRRGDGKCTTRDGGARPLSRRAEMKCPISSFDNIRH